MVKALPNILATIVEQKKLELASREPGIEERAEKSIAQRRDFLGALTARTPAVIAEIKKASPSKGVLAADFAPPAIARAYEQGGAAALSVLTDEKHFQGSLANLESARAAVRIPALRKDFTIDPYHVHQAAAHGADAILLIAAILNEREMRDLRELAERYRMAALVEVHDADELKPAVASGARVIGVNNRDLRTFEVTLETALRLADKIPSGVARVAESGIHSSADVRRLRAAGYQAFLVGEHLMKSGDPAGALKALTQ
ncbi:MAG TPA: indole-3-glycerol phosphate synthase TrpC [Bryobacteraceae bacterium]|nr:indole-3-glycerol phosphate synthase TrpC [Bryobacteraceae bacterium]